MYLFHEMGPQMRLSLIVVWKFHGDSNNPTKNGWIVNYNYFCRFDEMGWSLTYYEN